MKENTSPEELEEIFKTLKDAPFIDSFDFKGEEFTINMDVTAVMLIVFTLKTFICPKELWSQMEKLDEDEQRIMIYTLDAAQEKIANNAEAISEEGIKVQFDLNDMAQLEFLDLKNPYIMGDYCYFTHKAPDLFNEFKEFIYSYANRIEFRFYQSEETPKRFNKMVEAYKKCGIVCTIPRLSRLGDWTEEQVVKILWEMLRCGLARISMAG